MYVREQESRSLSTNNAESPANSFQALGEEALTDKEQLIYLSRVGYRNSVGRSPLSAPVSQYEERLVLLVTSVIMFQR
jgi:hypothetical protein